MTGKFNSIEHDAQVMRLCEELTEIEQRLIPTGLHVFGGLVVLAIFLVLGRQRVLSERQSDALGAVGYYWHFVDVVWVVVFSVIYLRVLP